MRKILLAAAVLFASPAFAEPEWDGDWLVLSREGGEVFEINQRGVQFLGPSNTDARVWSKIISADGSAQTQYLSVNCQSYMFRTLAGLSYDKNGNQRGTVGDRNWAYIAPDTRIDYVAKVLCQDPPK